MEQTEEKKKTRGLKLHKNKILEQEVVKWIVLEDISTYEIVKRLEDRHNYKIAPQSVEAWKENYLEALKVDVKDYLTLDTDVNLDRASILVELTRLSKIIDNRVDLLTQAADKRMTKDTDGNITFMNSDYEKMLMDYITSAIVTREKILKYTPEFQFGDVIRDIIKQVATVTFLIFNTDQDKTLYPKFKSELVDAERRLRDQYLVKELK